MTEAELSRFRATPEQVDAHLRELLAEDVYLAYQQKIGAAAVREAAQGLRETEDQEQARAAESGPHGQRAAQGLHGAADAIDPDFDGGPWPSVLVRHFGRISHKEQSPERGALRAYGRCQEAAPRGEWMGMCDRPLDGMGRCAHAADHARGAR
jgi:hypothetical protein